MALAPLAEKQCRDHLPGGTRPLTGCCGLALCASLLLAPTAGLSSSRRVPGGGGCLEVTPAVQSVLCLLDSTFSDFFSHYTYLQEACVQVSCLFVPSSMFLYLWSASA